MERERLLDHASAARPNPKGFVVLEQPVGQDKDAPVELGVREHGVVEPEQGVVAACVQVERDEIDAHRAQDFGRLVDARPRAPLVET